MTGVVRPMTLTFPLPSPGPRPLSAAPTFYIYIQSVEIAIPLRVILIPVFHYGLEMTSGDMETTSQFGTWKRLPGNECGGVARGYSNCWKLWRLLEAATGCRRGSQYDRKCSFYFYFFHTTPTNRDLSQKAVYFSALFKVNWGFPVLLSSKCILRGKGICHINCVSNQHIILHFLDYLPFAAATLNSHNLTPNFSCCTYMKMWFLRWSWTS